MSIGARILTLIVLTLSIVTGLLTSSTPECGDNQEVCGRVCHNSQSEICCGDHVLPRHGHLQCCNGVRFDNRVAECCGSEVVEISHCCGNRTFNKIDHICCEDNTLYSRRGPNDEDLTGWQCCGPVFYNPKITFCCENDAYPVSHSLQALGNQSIDDFDCHEFENGSVTVINRNQELKCAGFAYDIQTQLCCEDRLYRLDDNICCGADAIDRNIYACCRNGQQRGYINRSTHICCRDVSHERSPHPSSQKCCGTHSYDSRTQDCCHGRVFNRGVESCCGLNVVAKLDDGRDGCCNDVPMSNDEICCPLSGPVRNGNISGLRCCEGRDGTHAIYNPSTQICYYGIVLELQPITFLCGGRHYNPQVQLCCQETIRDNHDNQFHCCDLTSHSFHTSNQKCCAGRVHNISSDHRYICTRQGMLRCTSCCQRHLGDQELPASQRCIYRPGRPSWVGKKNNKALFCPDICGANLVKPSRLKLDWAKHGLCGITNNSAIVFRAVVVQKCQSSERLTIRFSQVQRLAYCGQPDAINFFNSSKITLAILNGRFPPRVLTSMDETGYGFNIRRFLIQTHSCDACRRSIHYSQPYLIVLQSRQQITADPSSSIIYSLANGDFILNYTNENLKFLQNKMRKKLGMPISRL